MLPEELPVMEFAFPGPLRDQLVAAVLDGTKTTTSGLAADYEREGSPLPRPGLRQAVIDSAGDPVAVIETTAVRVIRLGDVDLAHALGEGEGFTSVAEWRAGHELFWHSGQVRKELGDPAFTVDDDTLVVAQQFRLVSTCVTPDERWLAAVWPFVRAWLPGSPAAVVEIGCGPLGGFVPALRAAGYDAAGVDPEAPDGPWYHRMEFEGYEPAAPVQATVACTSLHHVADLGEVLNLAGAALVPGGTLIVVEWARERFDEATARWCFNRLPRPPADPGWLQQRYDQWRASGLPWDGYCRAWAQQEGLHTGQDILRELDARFDSQLLTYGPYFFPDLAEVSETEEQAAIDAGEIQANRIAYVCRRR